MGGGGYLFSIPPFYRIFPKFPPAENENRPGPADPLQDPLQGQTVPGLRQWPPQGARRQTSAHHLPPGRLHLPEGRHRQGDVHCQVGVRPGIGFKDYRGYRDKKKHFLAEQKLFEYICFCEFS